MKVLFFGTYDARRHPRIRVLQEGLRELGDDVRECNVPLGFSTDERVTMLRRPWRVVFLIKRIATAWRELRRRSEACRDVDVIIVGYMGHFDVHLARRLWPAKTIVLDHMIFARDTAIDRGLRFGPLLYVLDLVDRAATRRADIVCVDTKGHREMLPSGTRSAVVPVGATQEWFREPSPSNSDRLRVVFFGAYTPLQGSPTLGQAIAACADDPIEFSMVGGGQDLAQAKSNAAPNPHVTWREWIEPEDLPGFVAGHDVCLGIFGVEAKALRVVPHKVFQGAAAGCAIVTSDTPPQRELLGDAATYVTPGDTSAIIEALRKLAADRSGVERLSQRAYEQALKVFHPRVVASGLRSELLKRVSA